MQTNCPSCKSERLSPFYEVRQVPVHSCLMLESREEALRFPRGDIVLALCEDCGFITNLAYDPAVRDYSSIYEDQQSYSPTFNSFARKLAGDLITKHNLHRKKILEIGCGKGDFLALLCELGENRGVGIDPACVRERIVGEAAGQIEIIADYYSEKYSQYTGDFVVCRHTLEHIHSTLEFMSTVRRSVDGRRDTVVFFEIPDAGRVLRERAFWDIYYEHCSYFSPGSLARLFRLSGFEVRDLAIDYGDQYLLIEAEPSERPSSRTHHLEESVEQLSGDVHVFAKSVKDRIETWRRELRERSGRGKRVAVWGSGSKCVAFLTTLGVRDEVGSIVDVNPHRHGKFIPGVGREILPPESLREYKPEVVIVMNPIYEGEIRQMLADMDLYPLLVSL